MIIGIDAGHGGANVGCQYPGMSEKEYTLAVALAIRDEAQKRSGIEIRLSRESDVYKPFRLRAAKMAGSELVISLHVNAMAGDCKAQGLRLFYSPTAYARVDSLVRAFSGHWSLPESANHIPIQVAENQNANAKWLTNAHNVIYGCLGYHSNFGQGILIELFFASDPSDREQALQPGAVEEFARRIVDGVVA